MRRLVADSDNYVVIVDNMLTDLRTKLPNAESENWRFIKADCDRMYEM